MNRHASINRVYRLIWNHALGAFIPVAETTRGAGKGSGRSASRLSQRLSKRSASRAAGAAALSLTALVAQANPAGGQVTGGSGVITASGTTTTIHQSSQDLSLNWQSFNIAANQTVDFVQPSATAIAVNRILGSNGSVILGHLDANGQVYLINPNGVLFGLGSIVDVGGLVASTLDLEASTLGAAAKSFGGSGAASVINEGTITAATGGSVALLGNTVGNTGVISAQLGSVALGAGSAATLTFHGLNLVSLQIDRSVLGTLATNGGLIRADGGQVLMTAGAKNALLASVVNNTGVIEARTVDNHEGVITLLGGMTAGTVNVAGTIDASAPDGGHGGAIETSAAHVEIANDAKVSTAAAQGLSGTWLIDPTDFTISAGTTSQSASGIGATTLQGELASGNVAIATSGGGSQNGDIDVNAPVSWSAHALTLTAANNINVNAVMTVSGTAKVDFEPGASGSLLMGFASDGSFAGRVDISSSAANALTIGGQVYTVLNTLGAAGSTTGTDLEGIEGNLAGHYALGSDIDATGQGFDPIGYTPSAGFTGTFDGLGHTVTDLVINNPSVNSIGLFGFIGPTGIVRNVGVLGGSFYGQNVTGALAGTNYGKVSNTYATAAVAGELNYAGGLVGANYGKISNSYASGNITIGNDGGGLVGLNTVSGIISNSYATGGVGAESFAGGLVGVNYGTIINTHAIGAVGYGNHTGGLVGDSYGGTITNSYATGNVNAGSGDGVGGLIGTSSASITNSYATGTVSGTFGETGVGGLVGENAGAISASYATGAVSSVGANANFVGGLVGYNNGSISAGIGTITTSYATGAVSASGYAQKDTGGLVGYNNGSISAGYATGAVSASGYRNAGGLVGYNDTAGTITTSYASGTVTGGYEAGGLVGGNYGAVSASHATGAASGTSNVGGLIGGNGGEAPAGPVTDSYATGAVSGEASVGGLMGNNNGSVSVTFATGDVTVVAEAGGGLVGFNVGAISNSYATGAVNGTGAGGVGGLVGANQGPVSNAYSSGAVNGSFFAGGLIGTNNGSQVTNSFWDTGSSGQSTSAGGLGMTTAQLQQQVNFNSATAANGSVNPTWDLTNTWVIYNGATYPLLQYFMTPLTLSAANASKVYNGNAYSGGTSLAYSAAPNPDLLFGTAGYAGTAQGAINAGSYTITPSGVYSNQFGYDITFVSGTLTVAPRPLDLSASRVYNGTTTVAADLFTVSNLVAGQTLDLSGSGTAASANVANGGETVTTGSLTIGNGSGGGLAANYTFTGGTQIVNITPATLTVSDTAVGSKVYNGSSAASLTGGSLIGVIGDDTVTLSQAGSFASKNVGTGIAVTATDSLGGASAGDYVLIDPSGLTGNITPAVLTVNGIAVGSKVYNGTTTASLTGGSLVGVIGDDAVTLTQAGTFTSKNAGSDIAVTATDGLSGASAGNYLLVEPTRLAGDITPASLTVIDTSVGHKVYDGTTVAILSGGRLVGVVSGDAVSLMQAGTFASAQAGTGIAVTVHDSLGGANASDYSIIEPTGLTGSIVAATSPVAPATAGTPQAVLAAQAEIESPVLAPGIGTEPQTLTASTTIQVQPSAEGLAGSGSATEAGAGSATQPAVVVNVSMNIGANGTLTIQSGGLRLPDNLNVDTE